MDPAWVEGIRAKLPELPDARRDRFMAQYGLPLYDSNILTGSKGMADYFEECAGLVGPGKEKMASNWLLGDLSRLLNATNSEIENARISPKHLADMLALIDDGTITGPTAKAVLEEMFQTGKGASAIIAEKKLSQISDAGEIEEVAKKVLADNPSAVADYSSGKQQALMFLVGQVMKATKGRANPGVAKEIIKQELGGK
jgi:aspartyl-tRNA(Asn)/glutamyl-tRNA(Gln) amidotransferase subunit B